MFPLMSRSVLPRPTDGKSCANIISRCLSVCYAMRRAGSGGFTRTGGPGVRPLKHRFAGDIPLPRLSAIIITLNEAGNIAGCLDTLSFCDECIVVDGGSTDETVKVAQGKGARVVSHPFG